MAKGPPSPRGLKGRGALRRAATGARRREGRSGRLPSRLQRKEQRRSCRLDRAGLAVAPPAFGQPGASPAVEA